LDRARRRDRRGLGQAPLLDQEFERPVAAAAGRDLEHARLCAVGVEDRPDAEALQERAPGDVLGKLLNRDAGLQTPDVELAQYQLVEGDVARGAENDLLHGFSHLGVLRDGRPRDSLDLQSVTEPSAALSLSIAATSKEQHRICVVGSSLFARGIVTEGEDALQT
jgi:hypothetical protein